MEQNLPIIALIAGAFFGTAGWVATSAYMLLVLQQLSAQVFILKKTKMLAGDPASSP